MSTKFARHFSPSRCLFNAQYKRLYDSSVRYCYAFNFLYGRHVNQNSWMPIVQYFSRKMSNNFISVLWIKRLFHAVLITYFSQPTCSLVCENHHFGTVPLSFSMEAVFTSDTLIFTYHKHVTIKNNMHLYHSWKLKTSFMYYFIWKMPHLMVTHSASNSRMTVNDQVQRT